MELFRRCRIGWLIDTTTAVVWLEDGHARTILDVRGVYRANLIDADGATAGWLRVRISPHHEAERS